MRHGPLLSALGRGRLVKAALGGGDAQAVAIQGLTLVHFSA